MTAPAWKQPLIDLYLERALLRGDFTLASGKKSNFFLDSKQVTLHARGLDLISRAMLEAVSDLKYDAVGGLTIGADPIVSGMVALAAKSQPDLVGFIVRKETKDHGTQKFIEGPVKPGDKVLIVEDVVTTGGSALKAVDRIQEFGCEVICVVGICDRLEGGAAAFQARNLPFRALITIDDLGVPRNPN